MNHDVTRGPAIRVKLFAALADTRGWRARTVAHVPGMTVSDVWTRETGESALPPRVLCALNMEYCETDAPVAPGDEVGFFPPVTGGDT